MANEWHTSHEKVALHAPYIPRYNCKIRRTPPPPLAPTHPTHPLSNVEGDGRPFSEWLDAYAEFVLLRLQSFSPELGELAAIDAETPHEKASRSLEKV